MHSPRQTRCILVILMDIFNCLFMSITDEPYLQMYDLAYCKANQMLQKNRRALEKIVEELLEFEILTGKVIA